MNEFVVEGRDELAAAVLAAAEPTYEEARRNPVVIHLLNTSCKYFFKEGITWRRADDLAATIRKQPRKAFQ